MSNGYELVRDGMDAQVRREQERADVIRDLRGSNKLESAVATGPKGLVVYDPNTGGRAQFFQGRIRFWDDYDTNPDQYGEILVDPGAGINYLRLFPPHSDGTGAENSLTIQGRRPGQAGNAWIYTDGQLVLDAEGPAFLSGSTVSISSAGTTSVNAASVGINASGTAGIDANRIDLIAPALGLYELPTTSSGANLHLGTVGGQWTVALVTSSARYKQDIVDAPIDPSAPLRWRPRFWRDRNDVAAVGDDADFHHGFIAEEIAEESPACVRFDDEGRPDSLRQMHMLAEVVALCQAQQEEIAALTTRIEALEAQ